MLAAVKGFLFAARRSQRGFTLLEWLIGALVAAIVVTGALAGLRQLYTAKQVDGASLELAADLQWARARAMGSSQPVHLVTADDGRGWRVLVCSSVSACASDSPVLKAVTLAGTVGISAQRRFAFDAPRGLLNAGSQSACLNSSSSSTTIKVEITQALGPSQRCAVGTATAGLSTCSGPC